jgi:glycosyltransferase involved in cell wall biosynthesis
VIADDPRVRRQGDALHEAGWKVTAVGLGGGRSASPVWEIVGGGGAGASPPPAGLPSRLRRFADEYGLEAELDLARRARSVASRGVRVVRDLTAAHLSRASATVALRRYWSQPHFAALYDAARGVPGRLFVANDWNVLPIAARLAEERGGVFCYDTHEFAVEEYEDRPLWRWTRKPWVAAIEGMYVKRAAWVSTVSGGIAVAMQQRYALAEEPFVVRNAPRFVETEPHPTAEPIVVHYHGGLAPLRGLEDIIDSVEIWKPDRRLRIRGVGPAEYVATLRRRIDSSALGARIELLPPLPMTALIQDAASADVGIHALPKSSRQNDYALPNKFFEYVMAGLCLCVTDLVEMSALLRRADLGVLIAENTPRGIARAVNGLDHATIERCRANARRAARELCWESESRKLVEACALVEARDLDGAA